MTDRATVEDHILRTVELTEKLGRAEAKGRPGDIGPCDDCGEPATWFQPGIPPTQSCHACYVKWLESIGCRYVEHDHMCERGMRGCDIEHQPEEC